MKRNHDIPFLEDLQTAPRVSWGRRSKPASRATEKELAKWFIAGMVTTLVLVGLFMALLSRDLPLDRLDLNRDGKVTLTDLVVAKRLELDIKSRILGIDEVWITEPVIPAEGNGR